MLKFFLKNRSLHVAIFLVLLLTVLNGTSARAQEGLRLNLYFAEGTSWEYIEEVYLSLIDDVTPQYNLDNRWNPANTATGAGINAQGEPLVLTWSIIPDGTAMPQQFPADTACNSNLIAQMDATYGVGAWQAQITAVFNQWAAITGNQYVFEPNDDGAAWPNSPGVVGVRGDLRLGGCQIDGNGNILAFNFYPGFGGDMKIDTADNAFAPGNLGTIFHNVVSHEHGHAKGIRHVCPVNQTKLMEPILTAAFIGPQHDDIRAAQRHYGDFYEVIGGAGNDTSGQATDLGAPADGVPVTEQQVSIDDDSDQDWYQFTAIDDAKQVSVTVSPVGLTYLDGPQNLDGTCTPGAPTNSLTIHNLDFEIIDSDGVTVLATGNANPAGMDELLADVTLGAAGFKFIRVFGDIADDIQLYDLEIIVETIEADLSVTKTDRDDPITVGEQVTYDITVTNNGPDLAENVVLTDNLPGTVTFVSATPDQGSCAEAGGVVTCDLGDMASGASVNVTIIGTATAAGTITNNVSVTSDTQDPNPGDNSDAEDTKVTEADLSVDKTDLADPITVGEQVTYDITVTNHGPDLAENVVLTDNLPGTMTFVSATPDQGSCVEAGGVVTCDLGDMANGAGVTVIIIGTATAAGTITNNVCVDSDTHDPDPGNNCDDEETIVNELIYLSFASNGRVGGLSFTDDDILEYNLTTDSWSIYFDGSDMGIYRDVDGFDLRNGNILLTFDRPTKLPGLGYVAAADIVEFVPVSLGPSTSGSFNWFFDGSDVDLETGGEDIEAIAFAPDGRLVVSTAGTFIVSGLTGLRQDLLVFNDTSLGETTTGWWELYLDGTAVQLDTADENIWGSWIDPDTGEIYLTTKGFFYLPWPWIAGTGADIFICDPLTSDPVTSCDPDRYWDGSFRGIGDEQIDGFSILTKIP